MTNLEQRITELKAEMELCKVTMKMQDRINRIQGGDKSCAKALVNQFIKASSTLAIKTPKGSHKPESWKAWVHEWNIFCYSHKKEIYTLYVRNKY